MPVAAVDFYDVIRWVHITAVVVAFGPTFVYGIYLATAQRNNARSLPVIFEANEIINRWVVSAGAVAILATGIYMTIDRFNFAEVFVNVGLLAVIVLVGLVHGFFIPNDRRAAEIARREIDEAGAAGEVKLGSDFARLTDRSARVGMLVGLAIVVVLYFMTAKPFL